MGVSRPIYVNVDSPNLGFPYSNFLGGTSEKKKLYIVDKRLYVKLADGQQTNSAVLKTSLPYPFLSFKAGVEIESYNKRTPPWCSKWDGIGWITRWG